MTHHPTHVRWSIAPSTAHLDPERFLGELNDLPLTAAGGDWCTVAITDGIGQMRWTLVAQEAERMESLFTARRGAPPLGDSLGRQAGRLERIAERVGTDGSVPPARRAEGGANRSAAEPVRRGR